MTTARLEARHTRQYPPLDPALAERLAAYFAPHNARLSRLLGERFFS
jgi:hypothetical protein